MLLLELGFQSLPVVGDINPGKHWQLPMGIAIVLVALYLPNGIARLLRRGAADE
jgi:ABC-type branched-subunit amino acid transport system permease subunit